MTSAGRCAVMASDPDSRRDGRKGAYLINLLVYSIATPDPVEITPNHGPWAGERRSMRAQERKGRKVTNRRKI